MAAPTPEISLKNEEDTLTLEEMKEKAVQLMLKRFH
jgi:hypothetical protein